MGQQPSKDSKEAARLAEIFAEKERARQMLDTLRELAVEEDVARLPAGPGRHRARYEAAFDYLNQLANEAHAIHVHLMSRREGSSLPMPDPTPPLVLPPLPEPAPQAMPEATVIWQEGAQAGGVEGSEAAPLLAAATAMPAPASLRRRQGQQECG